jgi:C4-type Zn-finger protein
MHRNEFRMSKMNMVLNCTAGYYKSMEAVSEPSAAADDGTGTHHLIDTCFKFGFRSADIYLNQTLRSAVGEYKVDKDRIERADLMLNVLFGFLDKGYSVETEVKLQWSAGGCEPIHGTCDAIIYGDRERELYILDYKDGRVKVEVENNTQLMMYASAYTQMNRVSDLAYIGLGILQPKLSHEIEYAHVHLQILHRFEKRVVEALNKIPNGANIFNAGNWCKYCPFKGSCKRYADNALAGINTTRETVLTDSIRVTNDETPEMSDADLVALKKAAPLIKEMLIAVDKELYARAEVRTVEGVRLVEGRNQRSWKFDDEEILKKFDGVKIPKKFQHTMKVLSPAQFSKITWVDRKEKNQTLSTAQVERFFKNNLHEQKGRPQLALSDDSRQEVNNDKRGLFTSAGEI